ncbi:MAG: hypothetical protein WA188_11695 [Terriglobales bacterium]
MENVLVTTEVIAVTLLTFILALVIEPLLVMAVLALAKKAARRPPQPAPEPRIAELRLLATGPKNSSQD